MGAHPEVRDVRETAHAAQVRELDAAGVLVDPAWRAAFEGVPRHAFVPYFWTGRGAGHERLWGEDPDPEQRARWLRGVYTDTPLATRLRDGELVSSSSQPSLMAKMLNALDVRDGHRVLEIGTGTGYNAALLCHRLGDDLVTTVDLEEEITESARTHLAALGYRPTVVTGGTGRAAAPPAPPFDRILVTCTLPRIPPAWLGQCRPGARVPGPAVDRADRAHRPGRGTRRGPLPAHLGLLRPAARGHGGAAARRALVRAAVRAGGERALPVHAGADRRGAARPRGPGPLARRGPPGARALRCDGHPGGPVVVARRSPGALRVAPGGDRASRGGR
ncbi:hypothetical protein GCM10020254_54640 [Streptomyces goshikiensis]